MRLAKTIFVIVSLVLIFKSVNIYAQEKSEECTNPILLDDKVANQIVLKARGQSPDFMQLTSDISNAELRKSRINALREEFNSIDINACYKTNPIPIVYISDAMKGELRITRYVHYAQGPTVEEDFQFITNGLTIDNASEFNRLSLKTINSEDSFLKDLVANSKQKNGFAVVYFKGIHIADKKLYLPTIMPYSRNLNNEKVHVVATKIELMTDKNKSIFEKKFEISKSQNDRENEKAYSQTLARSENPGDFDIHGLKLSMTIEKAKNFALDKGWKLGEENSFANGRGLLTICSHDCRLQYAAFNQKPSGYFSIVLHSIANGKDKIINEIDSVSDFNLAPEEMKNLILSKYGEPLMFHDGHYYYGREITGKPIDTTPSGYDISSLIANGNANPGVPNTSNADHLLNLDLTQYDPNPMGMSFTLRLKLLAPPQIMDPGTTKSLAPSL